MEKTSDTGIDKLPVAKLTKNIATKTTDKKTNIEYVFRVFINQSVGIRNTIHALEVIPDEEHEYNLSIIYPDDS